ncbi:hypothetical protein [Metabacillus sp. 22489]|uniref:hypothetical protein n=1 Tax=Metabacillus sp. 22489 TaxID=3453928 RepID=UPI003F851141
MTAKNYEVDILNYLVATLRNVKSGVTEEGGLDALERIEEMYSCFLAKEKSVTSNALCRL